MPTVPKELKGLIPPRRINKGERRKRLTESQRVIFKKEFLEEYRKDDTTLDKASKKVGFSRQILYKWTDTDPEFAVEFEKLRFSKQNKSKKEWDLKHGNDEKYKKEFLKLYADDSYSVERALTEISKKLAKHDLKYWCKSDNEFKMEYKALQQKTRSILTKGIKARAIVKSAKVQQKQKDFLKIFEKKRFNMTATCKQIGIKRITVRNWLNDNPDFRNEYEELQFRKEDWAEDKLFGLVDEGNMVATIFLNKVLNQEANWYRKHRYIDQPHKIEGHVTHTHSFEQDQLDAMVRGQIIDRNKYENMLELDDPTIVDAEYTE